MSRVKRRGRSEGGKERDGAVCQYVSFTKTADKQVKDRARERERREREREGSNEAK